MKTCRTCEYCDLVCTVDGYRKFTNIDDACSVWVTIHRLRGDENKRIDNFADDFIDYLIENASEAFKFQDRELLAKVISRYLFD